MPLFTPIIQADFQTVLDRGRKGLTKASGLDQVRVFQFELWVCCKAVEN